MANTYTSLHYHIIFSTKNREPWIFPDIEQRIWRFMGGIARKHRMTALQIGGVEDHILRFGQRTADIGNFSSCSDTQRRIIQVDS